MVLLSANGMLRTILILLIVWLLLRRLGGAQQGTSVRPPRGPNWSPPDQRPPGEVRIERLDGPKKPRTDGDVEDADFEEIK